MNRYLQPDSRLIRFLTRTCDLIILNVLLILSCVTIVCSGAGITALYSVTFKMIKDEEDSMVKGFFRSLRDNYISSVPATLLLFVDVLLIALLHYALSAEILVFSPDIFILLLIFTILLTALLSYLFPLLAVYDNSFPGHLGNAARLALVHLPVTVLMTAVNLLPVWTGFLFPRLWSYIMEFWLLVGAAAGAYLNSFYLRRIFRQKSYSGI